MDLASYIESIPKAHSRI